MSDDTHRLEGMTPRLEHLEDAALMEGSAHVWRDETSPTHTSGIVSGLFIDHVAVGTVTFIAPLDREFGDDDVAQVARAVQMLNRALEQLKQNGQPPVAQHQENRLARQLGWLQQASSALATLSDEREIMLYLASALRTLFDADLAEVSVQSDQLSSQWSSERRGESPVCSETRLADPDESTWGVTTGRDATLSAALFEQAERARGEISVYRSGADGFRQEEAQVLKLFAQIATTALEAAELRHVIHNGETRLRLLIESAPVGIIEIDDAREIRWWNRSAAEIFAWPPFSQDAGATPILPPVLDERLQQLGADAFSGRAPASVDVVNVMVGALAKDLTVLATLLPSADGRGKCIWTLVNDVTSRRDVVSGHDDSTSQELRGEIASSVAHDFNNLLSLISGYAEILLKDHARDERAVKVVSDIQSIAARASVLTLQLQSVGDSKPSNPVVLCPSVEIHQLAEVLERIVGANVHVEWSLDPAAGNVRIDADQFEQMIVNLTLNARDAMPTGGELRISVDAVTIDSSESDRTIGPGEYLVISVSDTGLGMSEEVLEHCFEPMFTTKEPLKGTGLGLSTARRLVEESGGMIQCLSQVGQGTTFNIFLPKTFDELRPTLPSPHATRRRGSAKILVVEEDQGLRHLVTQALIRNGHQILEAENVERARELEHDFDGNIELLILGGLPSPESALNLATQLRSLNPTLKVLFMGERVNSSGASLIEGGESAFMRVPFKPSELIDKVHLLTPSPEFDV